MIEETQRQAEEKKQIEQRLRKKMEDKEKAEQMKNPQLKEESKSQSMQQKQQEDQAQYNDAPTYYQATIVPQDALSQDNKILHDQFVAQICSPNLSYEELKQLYMLPIPT